MTESSVARTTGAIYLLFCLLVWFTQFYVPSQLGLDMKDVDVVHKLMEHKDLFRMSLAAELLHPIVLLVISFLLFKLFGSENRLIALFMVTSVAIFAAISLGVTSQRSDAFFLADNEPLRAAMGATATAAHVKFKLDASVRGGGAHVFWGAWLACLGFLVFKSALIPSFLRRILGAMLMVGSSVWFFAAIKPILFPEFKLSPVVFAPTGLGEMGTFIWLLVRGVKQEAPFSENRRKVRSESELSNA